MRPRMLAAIATTAIVALGVTGCSSLIMDPDANNSLTDYTIAVEPVIGSAAVYLGVREGFFADEGIDLSINSLAATSDAVVDMVSAGHQDFGLADTLSLMVGQGDGAPLQVLSGAFATSGNQDADFAALVVKQESEITTILDIQGKNVSSPDPRSLDETVVRGLIDAAGGNPAGVHFIKVIPSGAVAALESDQVDVAFVIEPHLSWAVDAGHRILSYPYAEYDNNLSLAAYFTSDEMLASQPDAVAGFAAAMKKSVEFAEANPDQVRDIFASYTTTEASTRTTLSLPKFSTAVDSGASGASGKLSDTALAHGIFSIEPDLAKLTPKK